MPKPPPNKNAPTPSTRLLPTIQLKFFELNHPPTPKTPYRVPFTPSACVSEVLAGVLVLARPSAREDGTSRKPKRARISLAEKLQREISGNPGETPGLRGGGSLEQPG